MTEAAKYKIWCYLEWCGADAIYPFATGEQYRAFRDKFDAARTGGNMRGVDDCYYIGAKDRSAFEEFMRSV